MQFFKQNRVFSLRLADAETAVIVLKEEKRLLELALSETESANQVLRDEHQALQTAYDSIEEKLKLFHVIFFYFNFLLFFFHVIFFLQYENLTLVERLMTYKAHDAEILNRENENFLKYKIILFF